jgi:hypothetical protein
MRISFVLSGMCYPRIIASEGWEINQLLDEGGRGLTAQGFSACPSPPLSGSRSSKPGPRSLGNHPLAKTPRGAAENQVAVLCSVVTQRNKRTGH